MNLSRAACPGVVVVVMDPPTPEHDADRHSRVVQSLLWDNLVKQQVVLTAPRKDGRLPDSNL